jgi:heme/copper-type cytochrome/quinol oxidase subunit 3
MPACTLGMNLFLASEAMFFVGMLGSFLVLQSAQRALFHHMASMMGGWETAVLSLLLVAASAVILRFRHALQPKIAVAPSRLTRQLLAIFFAVVFAIFQMLILNHLLSQHTIVARIDGHAFVFNGVLGDSLKGTRSVLPPDFDATKLTPADFPSNPAAAGVFAIPPETILRDVSYGPSRNNYLACYFLFTAAHLVHLLAGLLAMLWLWARMARGTATAVNITCVYSYWHFVNIVGVLGLLLLYFA